ncbi:hypothetical protein PEC18_30265 [Paucibacter sp. O1-1]|nr:hypothetical protein [Paucibacter sp. O1-1]MDA3830004.1 hypothetical protein [Paucibacter sp. O1-1]
MRSTRSTWASSTSAGGYGVADLELREACVQLHVYAADVPLGTYRIVIGGEDRGEVTVEQHKDCYTYGEVYYRSPAEDGKRTLDFDPRGQRFDIVQNGVVFLTGVMPTQPTLVGDDQPGNDDG